MEKPRGLAQNIDVQKSGIYFIFEFDQGENADAEGISVSLELVRGNGKPNSPIDARFQATCKGKIVAEIEGLLRENRKGGFLEFRTDNSYNLTKNRIGSTHIPRVVGRTIAGLVSNGYIGRWYSDTNGGLTKDGKKLYRNYLYTDPRIEVKLPCLRTRNRYLVTAKTS